MIIVTSIGSVINNDIIIVMRIVYHKNWRTVRNLLDGIAFLHVGFCL